MILNGVHIINGGFMKVRTILSLNQPYFKLKKSTQKDAEYTAVHFLQSSIVS